MNFPGIPGMPMSGMARGEKTFGQNNNAPLWRPMIDGFIPQKPGKTTFRVLNHSAFICWLCYVPFI